MFRSRPPERMIEVCGAWFYPSDVVSISRSLRGRELAATDPDQADGYGCTIVLRGPITIRTTASATDVVDQVHEALQEMYDRESEDSRHLFVPQPLPDPMEDLKQTARAVAKAMKEEMDRPDWDPGDGEVSDV